jgi:predicted RNase H-like HicB family nuclease
MIRRWKTSYSADVPDLPGCIAAAGTIKGVRKLIAKAIELHIDLMQQSGEKVPKPSKRVEFVIDPNEEEEICTWVEIKMPQPV